MAHPSAAKYRGKWWREAFEKDDWRIFEDFRYFLFHVWRFLELPEPTPLQYDIAKYLQHGPRRKIIEAYRGVGKSWITSAFVCWLLLRDPQEKILVVSASKDRADQFSTFTLRLISEMPLLAHLRPRPDQRQSMIAFDVGPAMPDHSPSVKSVGVFGQLTGSRANRIIPDDVEVPNNSETQQMRDKLAERVKEFDAILKPGGSIDYLGTPQTEESLYNKMPARGYEIRVWPARYPKAEDVAKTYGDTLAPIVALALEKNPDLGGKPTDAVRFDHEDLLERELSYGRSGFALQFMLDTRLSDQDRYPLKLSDLVVFACNPDVAPEKIVWSGNPEYVVQDLECVGLSGDRYYRAATQFGEWLPYTGSLLYIDPSGRGKDETAWAVIKMLNGYLYLPGAGGFQGGYEPETLEGLAKLAKDHAINLVQIEDNFGDGMFTALLRPVMAKHYPVTIEEVKVSRTKELRIISTLEPVLNSHRLIVDPSVIKNDRASTKHLPPDKALRYQLFYQLSRLTKEKGSLAQDDRLDALAGAVKYWTDKIGMDADQRIKDRQEQLALDAYELAFHADISTDGFAIGLNLEQARQVVRARGGNKRMDMV
ncbi:phage terminase large subunit [Hyphomicrobium sp. xq]|uniref:Phage terminase large subunit n=1 Tax=Hyphomicrobium album TaxID=2665159 RepID=A0A6I3KEW1_9HYPH|nr:phage terminase large subunit [Hyphomicrobium album]MTD92873.1 phage terminase large subunit [Hyphomicrobium album]